MQFPSGAQPRGIPNEKTRCWLWAAEEWSHLEFGTLALVHREADEICLERARGTKGLATADGRSITMFEARGSRISPAPFNLARSPRPS